MIKYTNLIDDLQKPRLIFGEQLFADLEVTTIHQKLKSRPDCLVGWSVNW